MAESIESLLSKLIRQDLRTLISTQSARMSTRLKSAVSMARIRSGASDNSPSAILRPRAIPRLRAAPAKRIEKRSLVGKEVSELIDYQLFEIGCRDAPSV